MRGFDVRGLLVRDFDVRGLNVRWLNVRGPHYHSYMSPLTLKQKCCKCHSFTLYSDVDDRTKFINLQG